jgi:hypothetical protein
MRGRRGFQRGRRAIYYQLGSVYGAPMTVSIRRRGRLWGAASCTESRGRGDGVGGVRSRSEIALVQCRCE